MQNTHELQLPKGDTFFSHHPQYEQRDYDLVMKYLHSTRVAVDVGAHVGYWTRRLAQDFASVYAFEAVEEHYNCLTANVPADNAVLNHCAIGAAHGIARIERSIANSGMSRVTDNGSISVTMHALDDFHIMNVDLIKIDVEGYELEVLKGATATLLREKPVLFIEILNATPFLVRNQILQLLMKLGYVMRDRIAENYIFTAIGEPDGTDW